MRSWVEGLLALAVIGALGVAMFAFTGESIGGETPDSAPETVDTEAAARGEVLADNRGCLECHSTDGSGGKVGPTWKGLAGSDRPLTTGEFVVADHAYLFASIVDPNGQVVEGFEAVMPGDYGETLTESEIEDLIAYIESLAS